MKTNGSGSSEKLDKVLLRIPVRESEEKMTDLKDAAAKSGAHIVFRKSTPDMPKIYYLRQSVANALIAAAIEFNRIGVDLAVEEAYRQVSYQKEKFQTHVNKLLKEKKGLSINKVKKIANTYIAGIPLLAAHLAGAAVDIVLVDIDTKDTIDMGCPYHTLNDRAITDYPDIPDIARKNRRLLVEVMEKHGFKNYPYEYWHFSLGDVCWAHLNGIKSAIYGPVEYDVQTGGSQMFCLISDYLKIKHMESTLQM